MLDAQHSPAQTSDITPLGLIVALTVALTVVVVLGVIGGA